MSLNIGIVLDHPKRDLPGVARMAHALARRGHYTSVIPMYEQALDAPILGLDAILVNYARPVNFGLVKGYHQMGIPVYVLDTEGGVLSEDGANSPKNLAAFIRDSGFARLLRGYFFWGSRLRDAFLESSGMATDQLHLSGCPRFDFASPQWRDALDFHRDGYVLVNANFPLVNTLFVKSTEEEVEALVSAGWRRDYLEGFIRDQKLIFTSMIEAIHQLAESMPGQSFLVRPHPFENQLPYREALVGLSNVVVEGEGSVLNVIRHSKCILHLNCGTAVEANMLDRLPISLEFLNTEHAAGHSTLPSRVSLQARSLDEVRSLITHLTEAVKGFPFASNHSDYILPWFHENDGGAGDRIAEVFEAQVKQLPPRGRVRSTLDSMATSRRRSGFLQRSQSVAANLVGSKVIADLRAMAVPARREKRLRPAALDGLLLQLAAVDGSPGPKVVRALHPLTGFPLSSLVVVPHA